MDVFGEAYQLDKANLASAIGLCIFGLVFLAFMHWYRYHRHYRLTRTLDKVDGILLGKKFGLYAYLPAKGEKHVIVYGSSGQGKTSAILIPTLRSLKSRFFAIDIAGDINSNVERPDKLVYDFNDPNTIPYNVFSMVDQMPTKAKKIEALCQIAEQIIWIDDTTPPASRFFLQGARALFKASLITFYKHGLDFIDICRIIANCDFESLLLLLNEEDDPDARPFYIHLTGESSNTKGSIMEDLGLAVQLFAASEMLCRSLRRPKEGEMSVDPRRLEDHCIFVCIPEASMDLYAPLVRLISDQCFTYLYNRPEQFTDRILLCLDEFTEFRGIDVEKALRMLRKHRVRLLLLTQSKVNLDNVYGAGKRASMMNNLPLVCIMNMSGYEERSYFSDMLGRRLVCRRDKDGNLCWVYKKWLEPEDLERLEDTVLLKHAYGVNRFKKANYWKERKKSTARKERKKVPATAEEPFVINLDELFARGELEMPPTVQKGEPVSCCVTVTDLDGEEQIQKKSARFQSQDLSDQIREAAELCAEMARQALWDAIHSACDKEKNAHLLVQADVSWGKCQVSHSTHPPRPIDPAHGQDAVDTLADEVLEGIWKQLLSYSC